ncbi:MAG: DUF5790 family protein [Natronomonas sp.]
MSQATFEDDELFGEAASEMRSDVETHLQKARESLPDPDDIWDIDAENSLGALNALKEALDTGDAEAHLRDARKWFTMGKRADAFEDAEDLEAELEAVTALIETIGDAHDDVSDLASTLPGLRGDLQDLQEE